MNKVYVIWNPLYEIVVCVHTNEEECCAACDKAREDIKDTGYFLRGDWFEVNSKSLNNKIEDTNNEKYNQITDEVYEKYHQENKHVMYLTFLLKDEFINKIITDPDFSKKWGLKIEERELSAKERIELAGGHACQWQEKYPALIEQSLRICDEREIPTKLITIIYKGEKIEVYE